MSDFIIVYWFVDWPFWRGRLSSSWVVSFSGYIEVRLKSGLCRDFALLLKGSKSSE